jgi:teichuronic acid biosynthesis glycosyltransferase TuaG
VRESRGLNLSNKVSIIIPVYNCQKYVGYAIESALNQTYEDVEVIVIDDGSFDDTLDIITQFDGITVLVKNNGGTASALNEGIKTAKGDWIHWLSADDVLHDYCNRGYDEHNQG